MLDELEDSRRDGGTAEASVVAGEGRTTGDNPREYARHVTIPQWRDGWPRKRRLDSPRSVEIVWPNNLIYQRRPLAPAALDKSDLELLRGTLDLLILRTLSWGPRHGLAVLRWIEESTVERLRVEEGALYPALHRMEDKGWLDSLGPDTSGTQSQVLSPHRRRPWAPRHRTLQMGALLGSSCLADCCERSAAMRHRRDWATFAGYFASVPPT